MKNVGLLSSNLSRVIVQSNLSPRRYHLAASRLGDICDRSMTRGKLLDNNPTIFIFIS